MREARSRDKRVAWVYGGGRGGGGVQDGRTNLSLSSPYDFSSPVITALCEGDKEGQPFLSTSSLQIERWTVGRACCPRVPQLCCPGPPS